MAGPRTRKISADQSQDELMGEVKATLNYLKEDFGLMRDELKVMNKTLAVNTEQLRVHIEGVVLAREQNALIKREVEAKLDLLEQHFEDKAEAARENLENKIDPIQAHVTTIQTYLKVAAWIAGVIMVPSAGYGLTKIFEFLLEKLNQ